MYILPPTSPVSDKALIIFSGGQDSTTALFWAKNHFKEVVALTYQYGQLHSTEIEQAKKIAKIAGIKHLLVNLTEAFNPRTTSETANPHAQGSALLAGSQLDINASHPQDAKLPATFVPGRNAIFLTVAASVAYSLGARDLITGVCESDNAGYPDCRKNFIEQTEASISSALDCPIRIHTPLITLSKAQIWAGAFELGILEIVRELTHTDYRGDRANWNPWGYGTLDNTASQLRADGYFQAVTNGWIPGDPVKP